VSGELIEALRSKLRRIFDSQEGILNVIRSLTPQQAARNALAAEFNSYIFCLTYLNTSVSS